MQNEKRDQGVIIIEKGKKNDVFTVSQHTIFLKKEMIKLKEIRVKGKEKKKGGIFKINAQSSHYSSYFLIFRFSVYLFF
jgi:hypothetical protein